MASGDPAITAMETDAHPLIANLAARDTLSEHERAILRDLCRREKTVPAKFDIVEEGASPTHSCLMIEGYSARYHILADGRRQISAIHIAGDFVDLHSFLLGQMDHGVASLTECRVSLVPHEYLRRLTESEPHLSRLFWLSTLIDAAIHRIWLVAAGRLSAIGQLAHLICETYSRLLIVKRADHMTLHFPISQIELGDALGLSSVHVNRTIRELRERGLVEWRGAQVTILDWGGLVDVAQFDPTYLNCHRQAR